MANRVEVKWFEVTISGNFEVTTEDGVTKVKLVTRRAMKNIARIDLPLDSVMITLYGKGDLAGTDVPTELTYAEAAEDLMVHLKLMVKGEKVRLTGFAGGKTEIVEFSLK